MKHAKSQAEKMNITDLSYLINQIKIKSVKESDYLKQLELSLKGKLDAKFRKIG